MPMGLAYLHSGGRLIPAPHHRRINNLVIDVVQGRVKRAVVTLPPQRGKSTSISQYGTAWALGRYPRLRVILTSYSSDYAESWGSKSRDVIMELGKPVYGISLVRSASTMGWWEVTDRAGRRSGGGMVATGIDGAVTGKGADLFIIDDPLKGPEEADSKRQRDKIWDWYQSVAQTRLSANAGIIVVATRWNEDDLSGRLLAGRDGATWVDLRFPELAEEGDPLGRAPGEPLWPDRYPLETVLATKRAISPYWWSALYQGHPAPAEGALFKREGFKYFDIDEGGYTVDRGPDVSPRWVRWPRELCRHYLAVDSAIETKKTNDYTAIAFVAMTSNDDLLLLDVVRQRLEGPDLVTALNGLFHGYHPHPTEIKFERSPVGIPVIQTLRTSPYNLPIDDVPVSRDKVARALPVARRIQEGRVYFRRGAGWLDDFEDELLHFPNGAHDDQVDCLSLADSAKWAHNQASVRVLD
jgi:predicted phage terminase large subunit-like protein